jgi:uncharacterized Zn-binding protein involved in type VI secretion
MSEIVRLGDQSDHGGVMITATGTFVVDGKATCISGNIHKCPIPGHGDTPVTATRTFRNKTIPVICVGDKAGCGATLIRGSSDTNG